MQRELLRFSTAGSVDDGKSTLIGRLLHDTRAIYDDQIDSARQAAGGRLDLAFITDGLRSEREQGITIDVAYRHFSTPRRRFIIADTPGHEQYTRNMATGASTSQVSVILLDARKGVLPQTRRHLYIAWLLGIRRMLIAVNKMDLVAFSEDVFASVRRQVMQVVHRFPGLEVEVVPVCAADGDNIAEKSGRTDWYAGQTVLDYLETVPTRVSDTMAGFRFPVQYVARTHDFRGYAGQIVAGTVRAGDRVALLPSGRTCRIARIITYNGEFAEASAPQFVTLCLDQHVDLGRGDMVADIASPPVALDRLRATLVWMSNSPLSLDSPYLIKHTTQRVCGHIARVTSRINIANFEPEPATHLSLNDIGVVDLVTHKSIFCDAYSACRATGSLIVVHPITNETVAAGMIAGPSEVSSDAPAQPAATGVTVWFTGLSSSGKSTLCRRIYERLWAMGLRTEWLDGDELRQHLCSDLRYSAEDRNENVRRIAFVAELLCRNGVIVLVSAIAPYRRTRDEVRKRIGSFVEVYVNAPVEVCERRDVKGLYAKARSGELRGLTGVDDPYEPPLRPDVECRTDRETVAGSAEKVLDFLKSRVAAMSV